jgi:hypothetical protein
LSAIEALAVALAVKRPVLKCVISGHTMKTQKILIAEERFERKNDKVYWEPLKKELEALRLTRVRPQK